MAHKTALSEEELLDYLESLCRRLARKEHSDPTALFELTKTGSYPPKVANLAESFGMMLVKVEAREYRLENLIQELKQARDELAAAHGQLVRENKGLKANLSKKFHPSRIIGHSPAIRKILDQCDRIADTSVSVLITGETGTGKELIAKTLHFNSERRAEPFMAINCSAIPETLLESELFGIDKGVATGVEARPGIIERANGGTLFLDEIADMPLTGQAKMLRVLEEREIVPVGRRRPVPVDIRVVAATSKDLDREIEAENFRHDLYFRLNVVNLHLPPLRERKPDIALLLKMFLENHTKAMGRPVMRFTPGAMESLTAYPWPGNIRELDNEVERVVALAYSSDISRADLSPHIQPYGANADRSEACAPSGASLPIGTTALPRDIQSAEIQLINAALDATGNNKSQAAKRLGISREGLRKKMKRFGMAE